MKIISYNGKAAGMNALSKELTRQFERNGYRITKARGKILDILSQSSKHMSVDDIYMAIKSKGDSVGVTTIYRALDSLAKAGLVRKMSLTDGCTHYELIDEKVSGHHHHLICRNCLRVTDYSNFVNEEIKLIKKLEKIVSKVHKFKIDDHQLSFTGLCGHCIDNMKGGG